MLLHPRFRDDATTQVLADFDRALALHATALGERAQSGHVREGHGDLRPEHICLADPPLVIDCLEFNRMLRECNPYDELAFLGLECRTPERWLPQARRYAAHARSVLASLLQP